MKGFGSDKAAGCPPSRGSYGGVAGGSDSAPRLDMGGAGGLTGILFPWTRVEMTKDMICKGTISAIVGVLLGIISSLIVNCTLVEISVSSFFSLYLGIVFITVGAVILWRINVNADGASQGRKLQLTFFAGLIVFSGVLCFVLKRNWFVGLHAIAKVPLYTILGVSVAFALTFSLVDVVNYLFSFFQSSVSKPLVESREQAYMVLFFTLIMGGVFGCIFGMMDVEDEMQYQIKLALLREQQFCYPLGALIGGLAGFSNEILRQSEQKLRYYSTEFDEDI
ncbi:uncharacterized protein LOC34617344 [Cyclospora cayetanensis]|uniref:Uncharacterized protein n=2 Tax=Cyclospora cayetanensis TaxID=88456 RepID=A0A1D3D4Q1_9EIME|nr:uncharacterized protein LOC34617344 [Cyclospora cayetanensis]OEH78433.1 hypothetical protein cyc_00124 [Cyclospora cayetanensis]